MIALLRRFRREAPPPIPPLEILRRLEDLRRAQAAPRLEARGRSLLCRSPLDAIPVVLRPDRRGDDPEALALRRTPATEAIRGALRAHPGLLLWTEAAGGAAAAEDGSVGEILPWSPGSPALRRAEPQADGIPEGLHRLVPGPLSAHRRAALGWPIQLGESLPEFLAYTPGAAADQGVGLCIRKGRLLALALGRDPRNLFLLPLHQIP